MDSNVKLGRLFGVPIGLHWSWFLIFSIVTWSLAAGIFKNQFPGLSEPAYWSLGVITSLLLFASVLAHEFGHAVISIRNHIPVRRITLFIFGGVAQIEQEPQNAGVEFRIAVAGPLVSLALGLLFNGLYLLAGSYPYLAGPTRWLSEVNYTLVAFNMIPAFPLDGGRVFRSIFWALSHNYRKATRVSTLVAQVIAFVFIVFGVFNLTRGSFMNGLWLMFIGWFLLNAAQSAWDQENSQRNLSNVRVIQVMDRGVTEIPANISLESLVQDKIIQAGHRSFVVVENDRPLGLVAIRDIITVPRQEWSSTYVNQVMVPWDRLSQVSPDTALSNVLQTMEFSKLANVPVVTGDRVEGLLTREQILHYIRTRSELDL